MLVQFALIPELAEGQTVSPTGYHKARKYLCLGVFCISKGLIFLFIVEHMLYNGHKRKDNN
jgi:hypothetical protein